MSSYTYRMLLVPFLLILFNQTSAKPVTFNLMELGAKPDGKTDSTKSFLSAWSGACMSETAALIYVPRGRFLIQRVYLRGNKCRNNNILFRIDGVLVAPTDFRVAGNATNWLDFRGVDGVTISGGILDGKGTGLWDCKLAGKDCPVGASVSFLHILPQLRLMINFLIKYIVLIKDAGHVKRLLLTICLL